MTSRPGRAAVPVMLAVTLLAACTPSTSHPDRHAKLTAPASVVTTPSSPTGSVEPGRHTELRFTWGHRGRPWRTVLTLGYGARTDQVGIETFLDQAPIIPSALAVTPDGFAVLDPAKRRAILVSRDGRVIRAWSGIPQVASDMVYDPVHDRLVVVANEPAGQLMALYPDGHTDTTTLRSHVPVRVTTTEAGVSTLADSQTRDAKHLTFLPVTEDLTEAAALGGIPLAATELLTIRGDDGRHYRIRSAGRWRHHLTLAARTRPHQAVAPLNDNISVGRERIHFGLQVGAFRDYPTWHGQRPLFLLTLDRADGRVVSFSQVAICSLPDITNQYTFFTTSPTGRLYQLCLGTQGIEIRTPA